MISAQLFFESLELAGEFAGEIGWNGAEISEVGTEISGVV